MCHSFLLYFISVVFHPNSRCADCTVKLNTESCLKTQIFHPQHPQLVGNTRVYNRQQRALALVLVEGLAKLVTLAAQGAWTDVPVTTQAALLSRLLAVQFDPAGTPEVVQALAAWSGRCGHFLRVFGFQTHCVNTVLLPQ